MKSLLLLLALGVSALAQIPAPQPATALAPELAPLAAKHKADLAALETQRAAAFAPWIPPYFARLDAEEKSSLNRADIEAVAAIRKERDAVKAGGFGDLIASPFPEKLPAVLKTSRDTVLQNFTRIAAAAVNLRKKADADYLRALAVLEPRAAANPELARQIKAESDAVFGNPVTTVEGNVEVQAKAGKIINGDFSQIDAKGVPVGWKITNHSGRELSALPDGTTFTFVKEGGQGFLRMSRTKPGGGLFLMQEVEVRRGARELDVNILVRGETPKGGLPRVPIEFLDDQSKPAASGWAKAPAFQNKTNWVDVGAKVNLAKAKDVKTVRIRFGDDSNVIGTYDFKQCQVKSK